jgi:GH15 family glucan-1,4-alpha-glucosidase
MFAGLSADNPMVASTLQAVESRLLNQTPIGGVLRYEHDGYFLGKQQYKGNPWIVCTLWLAQIYMDLGRRDEAKNLLEWVKHRALLSGVLSEQFDPEDGAAMGVTPLVWSHAEFVNTVLDLAETAQTDG